MQVLRLRQAVERPNVAQDDSIYCAANFRDRTLSDLFYGGAGLPVSGGSGV